MYKDIWIARISDYRKWCIRLYVELYKGNEPYRNVYYDIRKGMWYYDKQTVQNGVDFEELEVIVRPILEEERMFDVLRQDLSKISFQELADEGYNYYGEHPEFKSKYNIGYENMQKMWRNRYK